MNNYGNRLRTQLDKLENNIDLMHVKQTQIQRGEIHVYSKQQHRRFSAGILENSDGRRRPQRLGEKKIVRFHIDEEDEKDRELRLKKKRILRSRKFEAKPIMKIRQQSQQQKDNSTQNDEPTEALEH